MKERQDDKLIEIANDLKTDAIVKCGVFVDLPNGNKGLIMFTVVDFRIKTKNSSPDKIVKSSYAVELPEMQIAMNYMKWGHAMFNKKRIGIIILCALFIISICASGCIGVSSSATTITESQFKYDIQPYGYSYAVHFYVDPKTGINYLIYGDGQRGGMCPRYNINGTLYISEMI